jgi:hypothetical protein
MPSPAGVLFEPFLSLLYPAHCAQCGRRIAEAEDFCGDWAEANFQIQDYPNLVILRGPLRVFLWDLALDLVAAAQVDTGSAALAACLLGHSSLY